MQNNARIGGILSIVAGGLGCIGALLFIAFVVLMMWVISADVYYDGYDYYGPGYVFSVVAVIYGIMGLVLVLFSVLAIVGGAYALRKKNWGLALAGSIGATLVFFPCGIPAIIFTALAKQEFDALSPPEPPA